MIINLGYWTRVGKNILIVALILLAIYLSIKLSLFFMPFLIAFCVSVLIEPIIKFIRNRTNLTRKSSAIIVMSILFILIIGLIIWGIVSLISEVSNILDGLNGYYEKINTMFLDIINGTEGAVIQVPEEVRDIIANSSNEILTYVSDWVENFLTGFLNSVTSLPIIAIYVGITLLAIYFMSADRIYILDQIEHHMPRLWVKRAGKHIKELASSIGGYLKAELILIFIAFIQVLIGLLILKTVGFNIAYPLTIAIAIGFVDALPILGSGTIMIPWAIIAALNGDLSLGVALLVLWMIVVVVRQLIEPKIVSNQIGIHPIFTLIAMYAGFRFIGVTGLILGPIILIILKNVLGTFIDKGIFKAIFDKK